MISKLEIQMSGGSFYIASVKLYKLMFSQFFLLQCTISQHHLFFLLPSSHTIKQQHFLAFSRNNRRNIYTAF